MVCDIHPVIWSLLSIGIFIVGYIFGKINGVIGDLFIKFIKDMWERIRSRDVWIDISDKIRFKKKPPD